MMPLLRDDWKDAPVLRHVLIVDNTSHHGFPRGDRVEVVEEDMVFGGRTYVWARNEARDDGWYLLPTEYVEVAKETELESLRKAFTIVPAVARFEELLTADVAAKYEAIIAERVEDTVKQRMVKFELDTIRKVEELAKPKLEYERKEIFRQVFLQQTEKLVEILYRRRKEDGTILAQLEGAMTTIREAPNALVRNQVQAEIQKPLLPKDEEDTEDGCDCDECEDDCDY